ncbi:hypothetical protein GCM10008983_06680 [Lentibacillus halophilus]|uniref:YneF family protein n=1 Tax=Lentibacillus halophilus TaxID=295065 RepID=A0ABP3IYB7_9BACI
MNNVMTSVMAVGAAGAAIYGIRKGMQNGTFQRMPQSISNMMNNNQMQNNAKQQSAGGNMPTQQFTSQMKNSTTGSQNKQQQMGYQMTSQ